MEKKKKNFSIRRLIYNDKYLIIVSLLLAIVIWVGASLNVGTDESKTIKMQLPITLSDKVSEQLGMQYYSLQDEIELKVNISGQKYVIGQVTEDDLSVSFDTNAVTRVGAQTIPIRVTNASKRLDFEITDTYPNSIEGYFDVNASKVMNIELSFDKSNVASGYVFGDPVMSEDKIIVSGPKTFVDRIEKAQIDVDFDGQENIAELYKNDCRIELIGSGIEHGYLTVTSRTDTATPLNTVNVTIPVLKKTTLPVNVELTDKPSGISDNDVIISYDKKSVKAGVLDSTDIKSAVFGSISYNSINVGTQKVVFDISKLKGIKVLDSTKNIEATITVSDTFERKSFVIDKSKLTVEGLGKNELSSVKSISDNEIIIIAPKNSVINPNDISIKCDVSEKRKSNTYPITVTINNDKAWIYGTYTAEVNITTNNNQ